MPPSGACGAPQSTAAGSRTEVVPRPEAGDEQANDPRFLRLVGSPEPAEREEARPQVMWSEDVIDNEHMNKKKSKICCIYHPTTEFGESEAEDEDEEESDYSSSSDSSSGDSDSSQCAHAHTRRARRPRPNAYERQYLKKKPTSG